MEKKVKIMREQVHRTKNAGIDYPEHVITCFHIISSDKIDNFQVIIIMIIDEEEGCGPRH